ncbi:MAG: sensor histidine kinase [Lachnospiraceae bacterium]
MKSYFKVFKSLNFRLFVTLFLLGIIPAMVVSEATLNAYYERAISGRTTDVQNQCKIISNQIIASDYLMGNSSDAISGELSMVSSLYDGRIMIIDQDLRVITDTYGFEVSRTMIAEEVIRCFKTGTSVHVVSGRFIEVAVPIQRTMDGTDQSETLGVILVSASLDSITDNREVLQNSVNLLILITASILLLLAAILSVLFVLPFKKMTKTISAITAEHIEDELKVYSYTETEQISEAFNQLLGKIKLLDESRQEFVSNVSHELKTPLTSMKVLADSLVQQPDAPVEFYREFMEDIAAEIDRENEIITDLLTMVKLDKTSAEMNIQSKNINDLLELILKRLRPIASQHNIEIVFESFREINADVDEVKLTLALTNFVENAIKYNKENGWVHVSLDADHKYFYVKVIDSGCGIPEEAQEHIFERFYRVDKSHSREIGGTGLGLAIAKNVVLMHKGIIEVSSIVDEGTTITVRIPLNYIV